ncbi:uncharacterized protein H6S33_002257 [Morchella sextelata]|uniref:uncharacterized protein n=1 Tax=Morchella sextelata TaxID=1174677 RepID=UPI001D043D79|nr:uncharacterized protein H6S33_002257 [Morchella sextelata]KAH0608205.1 hypothetical protein H6S33_002257 [Morchella sextelata]
MNSGSSVPEPLNVLIIIADVSMCCFDLWMFCTVVDIIFTYGIIIHLLEMGYEKPFTPLRHRGPRNNLKDKDYQRAEYTVPIAFLYGTR